MQKPRRTDFAADAAGQKLFDDSLKAFRTSNKDTKENAPQAISRKVYLSTISDLITRDGRTFRVLTVSDSDGVSSSVAINEQFYQRVKAQITPERYYDLTFEVRKANVTTFKDAEGDVQTHTTSGETLINFRQITERTFAGLTMSLTSKLNVLQSIDPAYSMAVATLLK